MTAVGTLALSASVLVAFPNRDRSAVAESVGAAVAHALRECQDGARLHDGDLDPTSLTITVHIDDQPTIGQRPGDLVVVEVHAEAEVPL